MTLLEPLLLADLANELPAAVRLQRLVSTLRHHFHGGAVALLRLEGEHLRPLAVDGLVRRDLRRWSGGRESSFVYHHAKRYTVWALTGGFGLYLTWPFGGFNPAYMVLVFTVLVAATLSTTVAAFKKYV